MHGACRIGGDEFHEYLFTLPVAGAAIPVPAGQHSLHRRRVIGGGEKKIQEPRPRHLGLFQKGTGQIQMLQERIRDLTRGPAERPGADHGGVDRIVPMRAVTRNLHDKGGHRFGGQLPSGHGLPGRAQNRFPHLVFRDRYNVLHETAS